MFAGFAGPCGWFSGERPFVSGSPPEGRPTRAPTDLGEPIGYVARIADPDGNSLELSFGQEVGLAVEGATKG